MKNLGVKGIHIA